MARSCPVCPSLQMRSVHASDVQVEVCPSCEGLWFDRGELDLFPDRPSVKSLLAAARLGPSRCRKLGHLVPRALAACATCRSEPVRCPACQGRLTLVTTARCAVDVCTACEGVWLDRGELELLEGMRMPAPVKGSAVPARWEVPEAARSAADPWKAPGAARALPAAGHRHALRSSVACNHCGESLRVVEAWAFDGDIYCGRCRPEGAVSGTALPADLVPVEGPAFAPGALPRLRAYFSDLLERVLRER